MLVAYLKSFKHSLLNTPLNFNLKCLQADLSRIE